jgi:hypothetical protein
MFKGISYLRLFIGLALCLLLSCSVFAVPFAYNPSLQQHPTAFQNNPAFFQPAFGNHAPVQANFGNSPNIANAQFAQSGDGNPLLVIASKLFI